MTNEEAKKMLKAKLECFKNEISGINHDCNMRLCDGCSLNYEQGNMGEQKEALDMAIKALEQQPILDTRQRERQLEMEYQHGYDKGWEEGRKALEQQPCEDCISRQAVLDKKELVELEDGQSFYCINPEDVETLLPVTPQRPKGKWIEQNDTSKHHFRWYYCSNCGAYLMSADGADYCSCCGAEMEGSNE